METRSEILDRQTGVTTPLLDRYTDIVIAFTLSGEQRIFPLDKSNRRVFHKQLCRICLSPEGHTVSPVTGIPCHVNGNKIFSPMLLKSGNVIVVENIGYEYHSLPVGESPFWEESVELDTGDLTESLILTDEAKQHHWDSLLRVVDSLFIVEKGEQTNYQKGSVKVSLTADDVAISTESDQVSMTIATVLTQLLIDQLGRSLKFKAIEDIRNTIEMARECGGTDALIQNFMEDCVCVTGSNSYSPRHLVECSVSFLTHIVSLASGVEEGVDLWLQLLVSFCQFTEASVFIHHKTAAALLGCMSAHMSRDRIQWLSCLVLTHMAQHQQLPGRKLVLREGALEVIMLAMRSHPQCLHLQHVACILLTTLLENLTAAANTALLTYESDYDVVSPTAFTLPLQVMDYIKDTGVDLARAAAVEHHPGDVLMKQLYEKIKQFFNKDRKIIEKKNPSVREQKPKQPARVYQQKATEQLLGSFTYTERTMKDLCTSDIPDEDISDLLETNRFPKDENVSNMDCHNVSQPMLSQTPTCLQELDLPLQPDLYTIDEEAAELLLSCETTASMSKPSPPDRKPHYITPRRMDPQYIDHGDTDRHYIDPHDMNPHNMNPDLIHSQDQDDSTCSITDTSIDSGMEKQSFSVTDHSTQTLQRENDHDKDTEDTMPSKDVVTKRKGKLHKYVKWIRKKIFPNDRRYKRKKKKRDHQYMNEEIMLSDDDATDTPIDSAIASAESMQSTNSNVLSLHSNTINQTEKWYTLAPESSSVCTQTTVEKKEQEKTVKTNSPRTGMLNNSEYLIQADSNITSESSLMTDKLYKVSDLSIGNMIYMHDEGIQTSRENISDSRKIFMSTEIQTEPCSVALDPAAEETGNQTKTSISGCTKESINLKNDLTKSTCKKAPQSASEIYFNSSTQVFPRSYHPPTMTHTAWASVMLEFRLKHGVTGAWWEGTQYFKRKAKYPTRGKFKQMHNSISVDSELNTRRDKGLGDTTCNSLEYFESASDTSDISGVPQSGRIMSVPCIAESHRNHNHTNHTQVDYSTQMYQRNAKAKHTHDVRYISKTTIEIGRDVDIQSNSHVPVSAALPLSQNNQRFDNGPSKLENRSSSHPVNHKPKTPHKNYSEPNLLDLRLSTSSARNEQLNIDRELGDRRHSSEAISQVYGETNATDGIRFRHNTPPQWNEDEFEYCLDTYATVRGHGTGETLVNKRSDACNCDCHLSTGTNQHCRNRCYDAHQEEKTSKRRKMEETGNWAEESQHHVPLHGGPPPQSSGSEDDESDEASEDADEASQLERLLTEHAYVTQQLRIKQQLINSLEDPLRLALKSMSRGSAASYKAMEKLLVTSKQILNATSTTDVLELYKLTAHAFTGGDVHFRLLEDINRLLQFSRSEAEIGEVSKMMLMILSGEYGSDVTEYVGFFKHAGIKKNVREKLIMLRSQSPSSEAVWWLGETMAELDIVSKRRGWTIDLYASRSENGMYHF